METLTIITNSTSTTHLRWRNYVFSPGIEKCNHLFSASKILPTKLHRGFGAIIKSFAGRKSVKKLRRDGTEPKNRTQDINKNPSDEFIGIGLGDKFSSGDDFITGDNGVSSNDNMVAKNSVPSSSRRDVLQACTVTSGLIFALGLLIRQVSHFAFTEGLPLHDCSAEVLFDFETWHLELITGLVVLISSCRYLLLNTWPDFAESSEAANQQVLSQLEPLDYIVVAFLPGLSEELLFRGALLPLFGLNWESALVVAAIFGVLHLGSGRRYSFAVWATFVGLAYGYATIVSASILVPMASHALNNLVGGILWRYMSTSDQQKK